MMGEFIRRNLLHRPLRTAIGVLAVGVEVALVVLIVGLTSGLLKKRPSFSISAARRCRSRLARNSAS